MTAPIPSAVLPLREALVRWCDPRLIEAVKREERDQTPYDLDQTKLYQLTPRSERRQPTNTSWMIDTDYTSLLAAWRDLTNDLRHRIESGDIYLQGFKAGLLRSSTPEPMPGGWAGDMQFEFATGVIAVGLTRYTGIACSRTPFNAPEAAPAVPTALVTPSVQPGLRPADVRPEDVPDLSDDVILALLEEHARRVVASPDAKLIAPGKISLLPIIKRRMEYRAAQGQLLPKLADEAAVLADWIASKIVSHAVPLAPTIAKVLGPTYAALRARSTAAIQTLKG